MEFFYKNRLWVFFFFLGLLLFSCVSSQSQTGRIRALEKRVIKLETQERQEDQLEILSKQFKRSLLLFSQQLDDLNTDRGNNVNDLEVIKQSLKKLETELRLLKLQQDKKLRSE